MKSFRFILCISLLLWGTASFGQKIKKIHRKQNTTEQPVKKEQKKKTTNNGNSNVNPNKKKTKKVNPVFEISANSASFSASGGSQTFYITSSGSWSITTNTASWGHLYQNGNELLLRVDANPDISDRTGHFILKSGSKTHRINITQTGETKFSISSTSADFDANAGSKYFTITANTSWRIKTNPNSWGHLTVNGNNNLILKVDANTRTEKRSNYFELAAGSKTIRVNITQEGNTGFTVSSQHLDFSASGGTKIITVSSVDNWDISVGTVSWGHVTKNGNQLTVRIDANNSTSPRSDYFKIAAGSKSLRIDIKQSGNSYISSNSYYEPYREKSFIHAQDNYFGGLSVGYIQKQWVYDYGGSKEKMGMFDGDKYLQGIQAGLRIDPQFGWGFGMNTGLFYEYCWAKSTTMQDRYGSYQWRYDEHGLYAPLDLKYTMNFSKWFQLSFYGGVGFNYVLSGKMKVVDSDDFEDEDFFSADNTRKFNMMLEYGASVRIKALQFDFMMGQGLTDWSDESGMTLKQGRPMSISATICF